MDLRKPDNISTQLLQAYSFLIDAQINSIKTIALTLNDTLDEYIYYMNDNFGMYQNRMTNKLLHQNKTYTIHVSNFEKFTQGEDITRDEKNLIIDFYTKLLKRTDNIIGHRYYLGKKFSREETKKIEGTRFDSELADTCLMNRIIFIIPKEIFNINIYNEYSNEDLDECSCTNLLGMVTESANNIIIKFDNANKNFDYYHYNNILYACERQITYYIDYNLSNDDKITIIVDYDKY